MSGYMENSLAITSILKGGALYLQKPFRADALLENVRHSLG